MNCLGEVKVSVSSQDPTVSKESYETKYILSELLLLWKVLVLLAAYSDHVNTITYKL